MTADRQEPDKDEDLPSSPTPGRAGRLAEFWHAFPFRWQILIAIALSSLLTWLVAGALAVYDSRGRAAIETKANLDLWESFISTKAESLGAQTELAAFSEVLARELRDLRHVKFSIVDRAGASVGSPIQRSGAEESRQGHDPDDDSRVPDWFVALVQSDLEIRSIPITVGNECIGTVTLTAKPEDEIAEGWELLRKISVLWLVAMVLMMVGLYFVLGHILDPLVTFATGMRELEDGHYGFRLSEPRLRELSGIARNFNTLATALERARADNSRLYRQLVAIQEDERRQIASDLHDEFGPCLFGINASACSIERLARQIPQPGARDILSAVSEIVKVNDRMKSINRSLLARLRPVALGRITVSELLSELISSFEHRHPDVHFERSFDALSPTFGEASDLTLYRCLQEGLTNALRHGRATEITISASQVLWEPLHPSAGARDLGRGLVQLEISDNGIGIDASTQLGFGLSAMRERVRSLAGTLSITQNKPSGTVLTASIPLSPSQSRKG